MIKFDNSQIVILFAGVAIFMYGMHLAGQSLEKLMANRISSMLNRLSESQFLAIVVGISLTTLLQSSGAVTSMLVSLGSAKVITLPQVMGVIIGTAIGSTLTVQLISLNMVEYAMPLFVISYGVYFFSKKPALKHLAAVGLGFGLLFFGLTMITQAASYYATLTQVKDVLHILQENPTYTLLISMLFCAVFHSSAVTIGIAMALAQAGAISLNDALFWVYGANVGTTSVALIASVSSNHIGKQVAWAHFFYKTLSVIIFLIAPVHQLLTKIVVELGTPINRSIANAHLILNVVSAILFFPFIKPAARFIQTLFPKDPKTDISTEFLNLNNYQSSALAISYANREILRTADIVLSMIQDSLRLFETGNPGLVESIRDRDNKVDFLYRETKMFLLDHANKSSTGVHQNIMQMIMFLSDLERAADSIDINIVTLAVKKNALKLEFSKEGWAEIGQMHGETMQVAQMAITAFNNREMCETAIKMKRDLARTEISLRESHIGRLNKGLRESINTSSIHLDLLSEYKRIVGLVVSHAYQNPNPEM